MMKRLISISLLLIFFTTVLAGCNSDATVDSGESVPVSYTDGELIKGKLGVPDTVQGEYVSESGISRVTVNASVIVPAVSKVDVVEAIPRIFADEEVFGVMERHHNDFDWRYAESNEPYKSGLPYTDNSFDGVDLYHLWLTVDPDVSPDKTYKSFNVTYWLNSKTGALAGTPTMEYIENYESTYALGGNSIPLTDGKAVDCTITLEEAIAFADEEIHAILPDYQVTRVGQVPVMEMGGFGFDEFSTQQYYLFNYARHLNGVPVNGSLHTDPESEYGYVSGTGEVSILVADDGVLGFIYKNPYDVGAVVEKDVTLMPFEEIWDIFTNISLLSIQHLEANEGLEKNEAEVAEVRFGYMSVLQADGSYRYIPVWDFYAYRILDGHGGYGGTPNKGLWTFLTINAIDGTIIDRRLGY